MKTMIKKDIVDFCDKFGIEIGFIEEIIVDELYIKLRNEKERREFATLMKKYGFYNGE